MSHSQKSALFIFGLFLMGGGIVLALVLGKPTPEKADPKRIAPVVSILPVEPETLSINVEAQGSVVPQREIDLVAQVGGRITKIAQNFFDGEFFTEEEALVWIDERDFRNALTRAEADVASAEQQLALEQAEADQAARDWELLGGEGEPTPLVLRKPQLAEAKARLDAARASLADARLNLERTKISVPFAGRVREKMVDIGQFVSPGTPLGTVYATDVVEIRLPLTDRQASFLKLPLSPRQQMDPVPVTIRTTFTGQDISWEGIIRRTEGAIDPRSRVLVAIAEVDDPFNLSSAADASKPPLSVGLFVNADIQGQTYTDIFRIPRRSLRTNDIVITVNAQSRLDFRTVDVLRTTAEFAYIRSGLEAGDRLLTTDLEAPINGMEVQVANAARPSGTSTVGMVAVGSAP
ncbi:MAG: efflux RND transporter periplasmic adaptor subunit [Sphingomonadales bacterium]